MVWMILQCVYVCTVYIKLNILILLLLLKSFLFSIPGEENSSGILWFTAAAHLLDTSALGLCVQWQHWSLCKNQKRIQTGQTGISCTVGALFLLSHYLKRKEEKLDGPAEPKRVFKTFFTYTSSGKTSLEYIWTGWKAKCWIEEIDADMKCVCANEPLKCLFHQKKFEQSLRHAVCIRPGSQWKGVVICD